MSQIKTHLLLVGTDVSSDKIIQSKLSQHGYSVDYVSTEQDLITKIFKRIRKIDIIIVSSIKGETFVSKKLIDHIKIPILVLNNKSAYDSFLMDFYSEISAVQNEYSQNNDNTVDNNVSEDQLVASALHEIICDENGKPIDYRFLDADKKFLQRLKKTKEELIGKTALELYPKIEPVWIETFGRVALSGKPEVLLQYSIEFDNYYEARIYSPEKGKFLALFIDMNAIKDTYVYK
jgi:PAS domain-containing protein